MIRHLLPQALAGEKYFRWRGGEVSRLEGLADGVFALALTLLIVSLEIPSSFGEMLTAFGQVPVFAVCFALLIWMWHCHFQFHRRYGLEDAYTVLLNSILLFSVLVYVYPLKFLFTLLFEMFFGIGASVERPLATQWPALMILYSAGFAFIFVVYSLLTWHAWRYRERLDLDARERLITLATLRGHLISVGVGLLSVLVVVVAPRHFPYAGLVYFLMGPTQAINGWLSGRKVDRLPS